MRWNTRIATLAGVGCVIAAVLYFRIFQPGQSYSAIRIDFEEPAADPFELVLANRSNSGQDKLDEPAETGPKISEPSGRIAAPSPPEVKQEQAKPILAKKVPEGPAPVKRVVVEVRAKGEAAKPQGRVYTVKAGDSLWRIARDQLGDASRHLELAKLNEAALGGDPDNLKPGQTIILPPK